MLPQNLSCYFQINCAYNPCWANKMIKGVNHITLSVSDLGLSLEFYVEVLGFILRMKRGNSAYLSTEKLWLCLVVERKEEKQRSDYSHIAFDVDQEDFRALKSKIERSLAKIWQPNSSEGPSLYFEDLDGHRLEIHVGNLESRIEGIKRMDSDDIQVAEETEKNHKHVDQIERTGGARN